MRMHDYVLEVQEVVPFNQYKRQNGFMIYVYRHMSHVPTTCTLATACTLATVATPLLCMLASQEAWTNTHIHPMYL